jgi:malic enzyme
MFIFPGIGLGALVSGAKNITDQMFFNAAVALAERVTDEQLANGEVCFIVSSKSVYAECDYDQVFPRIRDIREVSLHVAAAVATTAQYESLATVHKLNWQVALCDLCDCLSLIRVIAQAPGHEGPCMGSCLQSSLLPHELIRFGLG